MILSTNGRFYTKNNRIKILWDPNFLIQKVKQVFASDIVIVDKNQKRYEKLEKCHDLEKELKNREKVPVAVDRCT